MKRILSIAIFVLFVSTLAAQAPAKYWVHFKDKANSAYSIERPEEFLSPRALAKRARFNIAIDQSDLPVNQNYIDQLLKIDTNMVLLTKSKWLNGVTVYSTTENIEKEIEKLPFVSYCECTAILKEEEKFDYPKFEYTPPKQTKEVVKYAKDGTLLYGYATLQVSANRAHWLHKLGAHGEGMIIAVFDAGFENADEIAHFEALREEGRLLGTRSFVFPGRSVFFTGSHGTEVLSCIAAYKPDEMIGTAPKASFYLAQTEDGRSENKIEEDNWVAAIEWADSLGCDVINSSLGYYDFDIKSQKYKYADMDGTVSRCSQAAGMAADKGMIVCASAGNEGNDKWHYITAPADADNIITVGAITPEGKPSNFSSYGPTADSRVKPDAAAIGSNAIVANPAGETIFSFGTSFSSPILAGMVACLWQLFPEKAPNQIINTVRLAGSHALSPTSQLGYGVTDFLTAYNLLKLTDAENVYVLTPSVTSKGAVKFNYQVESATDFTIECRLDGSEKSFKQTFSAKNTPDGKFQTGKLRLPKLPKDQKYNVIRLTITDLSSSHSYEQVIGKYK